MEKGRLFVLYGPAGSGKTVLAKALEESGRFVKAISCTTREKRSNERNNIDYIFLSREEFETRKLNDEFLETDFHHGNWYGILKESITKLLAAGRRTLIVTDRNGAREIQKNFPSSTLILLEPPVGTTAYQRLIARGMSEAEALARLTEDPILGKADDICDYHVVNENGKLEWTLLEVLKCFK